MSVAHGSLAGQSPPSPWKPKRESIASPLESMVNTPCGDRSLV